MRSLLSILLFADFLVMQLVKIPGATFVGGLYVCFYIGACLPHIKGMSAKITLFLLLMSLFLLTGAENPVSLLSEGAAKNLSIVCILMVTPLLGIPVRTGNYEESLASLLSRMQRNMYVTFGIFLALTHLFSVILNIGSIVINLHLMKSTAIRSKRLIAGILNRGYTTTSVWSPYLAVMTLVVNQLGIEWSALAYSMAGFVLLSLLAAFLTELRHIRKENIRVQEEVECIPDTEKTLGKTKVFSRITELSILLALSMCLVLIVEKTGGFGMALSITLVSMFFPIIWCLCKRHWKVYQQEAAKHLTGTVPNMQSEFAMFLSAGLFGHLFFHSSFNPMFVQWLNTVFGSSTLLMSIAISLSIIMTGIAGFHPAVMLTIFATTVVPQDIGLSAIYFAALLLGSAGIANTVSPGTAVNNLLAIELKEELGTISFKWNWLYALVSYVLLLCYLQMITI